MTAPIKFDVENISALPVKKLSGGAKGHLKDLLLLNEKTTAEMARGVAEGYLDRDGAIKLAEKLEVEPPRVKKRFYRYFTMVSAYSIPVEAYTEEEATAEAQRMHNINVAQADVHYGDRSRFTRERGRYYRAFSQLSETRPTQADLPAAHPWEIERHDAEVNGLPTPDHSGDISWDSLIPRH